MHWFHVHGVAVNHEKLCREAEVRVLHVLHPVQARHSPSIAGPGVGNLLVPTLVELESSPVVVAEHAEPWHAVDALTFVNALEDIVELQAGHVSNLVHGAATVCVDATPVEVVADVEDEVRVLVSCTFVHLDGNEVLGVLVDGRSVSARFFTRSAAEAAHHFLGLARAPKTSHRMRPWGLATSVLNHCCAVLHGSIEASPVTDREDVHLLATLNLHRLPGNAIVLADGCRR
mmetsp:Transcript_80108/g.141366  ORF Transcript_80108/g.141366 Transcript_80108/m.141366 type:complete len:231 (-) Transcript_80108:37-729(-)